jgi:hypothetical protein
MMIHTTAAAQAAYGSNLPGQAWSFYGQSGKLLMISGEFNAFWSAYKNGTLPQLNAILSAYGGQSAASAAAGGALTAGLTAPPNGAIIPQLPAGGVLPMLPGGNISVLPSAGNALSVIGSEAARGLLPQSSLVGRSLIPIADGASRALMVIPDAANGGAAGNLQPALLMEVLRSNFG